MSEEKKIEKGLNQFLEEEKTQERVVRTPQEIVEKVDKKLVVEDGRTLLRERVY